MTLPYTVTLPTDPNGEILLEITESDVVVKYFIQVQQTSLKIRTVDPYGLEVVPGENGEYFINIKGLI